MSAGQNLSDSGGLFNRELRAAPVSATVSFQLCVERDCHAM